MKTLIEYLVGELIRFIFRIKVKVEIENSKES